MAYVIVYYKDQEVARRKLDGPVTIGRSADCELSVHDIMLSRRHCQIEPEGDGWIISDLGSKNGTRIGGTPVFRLPLSDGDVVRMGNTTVRFRDGDLVPSASAPANRLRRPADPFEAMAGTITDFSVPPPAPGPMPGAIRLPSPRPSTREPSGYQSDEVRSLVSELVSSSWDSIHENARRPEAGLAQCSLAQALRRKRSREPRVDMALQVLAEPIMLELPEAICQSAINARSAARGKAEVRAAVFTSASACPPALRARMPFHFLVRRLALIFQWLALVMLIWPR